MGKMKRARIIPPFLRMGFKTLKAYDTYILDFISASRAKKAKIREDTLVSFLNGDPITMFVFPSDITQLKITAPSIDKAIVCGGLGLHYDGKFENGETFELKVTEGKGSSSDVLRFTPWIDTNQFLQGQVKSPRGISLFGEDMYRTWYEKNLSDLGFSYEHYLKASYDFGNADKYDFIKMLRSSKGIQKEYQQKWLRFEEEWVPNHIPDVSVVRDIITDILGQKTWWVCISKTHSEWVKSPKVVNVVFDDIKSKRDGGKTWGYSVVLQQGEELRTIPITIKLHWKNGGQAVQNLNFMMC